MADRGKLTSQARLDAINQENERLRKDVHDFEQAKRASELTGNRQLLWQGVKWGFRGFSNIAKSLSTPNSPNRMKIAQLPARRRDMDIVRNSNFSKLKSPQLRYMDIRGKRIKKSR